MTATAVLGGIVGAQFAPLMVTWGGALFGAALGAAICVSFAEKTTWGASTRLWSLAFFFGMAAVWAAEHVLGLLGADSYLAGKEELRPFLTATVAFYWRQIMTGVPAFLKALINARPSAGGPL